MHGGDSVCNRGVRTWCLKLRRAMHTRLACCQGPLFAFFCESVWPVLMRCSRSCDCASKPRRARRTDQVHGPKALVDVTFLDPPLGSANIPSRLPHSPSPPPSAFKNPRAGCPMSLRDRSPGGSVPETPSNPSEYAIGCRQWKAHCVHF